MKLGKIFRRSLIAFLITMNFFTAAHAEIQTYEGVGEYFMTDENQEFAKEQAELKAGRDILEQIKVYVKAHSQVTNLKSLEDEIIAIAAGVLYFIDAKFFLTAEDDGIWVKSVLTAQIDIDELEKLLEREIKSRLSK